ncbi:MAG TPA: STAS domain-containing protein [Polyangia bacterium]|nr:STAS domain-containing protein [Polyangia bacterium]
MPRTMAVWQAHGAKEAIVIQPSRMTFSIVHAPSDITRVAMFGRLDLGMVGVFRRELSILLRLNPSFVEVDMSHLSLIDSSGVELLLSFFVSLFARGGRIALCGLCEQPRELFKVMLIDAIGPASEPLN